MSSEPSFFPRLKQTKQHVLLSLNLVRLTSKVLRTCWQTSRSSFRPLLRGSTAGVPSGEKKKTKTADACEGMAQHNYKIHSEPAISNFNAAMSVRSMLPKVSSTTRARFQFGFCNCFFSRYLLRLLDMQAALCNLRSISLQPHWHFFVHQNLMSSLGVVHTGLGDAPKWHFLAKTDNSSWDQYQNQNSERNNNGP